MSAISEVYDAASPVSGMAPEDGLGKRIEELKSHCGFLIDGIDWAVHELTGWSLLEALFKPITGDFRTVASMEAGWGQVRIALAAVRDNYDALTDQVGQVWDGEAARTAQRRLLDIAAMHDDQAEAAEHLQDQLGHVVDVSLATAEMVAVAVSFINDVITELLLDAATGPLGWARGALTAPDEARRVISLVHRGLEAIERLTAVITEVVAVFKYLNAFLKGLHASLGVANAGLSAQAADHLDETAHHGFG